MGNIGQIFQLLIVTPLTNVLLAIYQLLVFLHVPSALGFSIVLMTIAIRFLLYPIMASQLKTSKKMSQLSPHLSKLKDQHKGDAQKRQSATMALYKEHGVNPAAGCLPMIIQLPVLLGLYNVLQHIITLKPEAVVKTINALAYAPFLKLSRPWDPTFFGLPLGHAPKELLFGHSFTQLLQTYGPVIPFLLVIIPVVTGLLQFFQSKMMLAPAVQLATQEKKPTEPDFATAFQSQSLFLFPAMLGFLSFTFALGLSFYWNTFTIFGMIQQYKLQGWGGLEPWIALLKREKPVTTVTPAVVEKPKTKAKKKHGK
jgi:YidC/Oxa1 family membrane protein insertase